MRDLRLLSMLLVVSLAVMAGAHAAPSQPPTPPKAPKAAGEAVPRADVNEEIRNNLGNQHLKTLRQELQSAISYDLDKDYFGSDAPPAGPDTKPAQNLAPSNPRGPAKPAPATQPKE